MLIESSLLIGEEIISIFICHLKSLAFRSSVASCIEMLPGLESNCLIAKVLALAQVDIIVERSCRLLFGVPFRTLHHLAADAGKERGVLVDDSSQLLLLLRKK